MLALRDGEAGFEVLMLRRSLNSDFVGGAYVFPGGRVDEDDGGTIAESCVHGLSDSESSRRLGIESGGLAYYVAGLRELFEEAGLLVVCDESGGRVDLEGLEVVARLAASRRAINASTMGFFSMVREEGLRLDLRGLAYLAHWVTPVGPPRRYDTRFFVARAPSGQVAAHDDGETVAETWVRPVDALSASARGELDLIFPTIRTLQSVARFNTCDEVLTFANAQASIPRIEPRVVSRDGGLAFLIPGDSGYD